MSIATDRLRRTNRLVAASLWLAAGAVYLLAEGLSASAFSPPYSYAQNYISDLGVAACGQLIGGRAICSPLHDLMNSGFIIQGLLFFAAAVFAARAVTSRARYALMVLAAVNCIGISLVGIFHEAAATQADATLPYHVLGAFLAIVAGNATALASSALSRELGLPPWHRMASIVLPIVGMVGLVMLIVAQARGAVTLVPDGIWERTSVYTITAWEVVTGVGLLAARNTLQRHH
jgi:hypothetical membrane protein